MKAKEIQSVLESFGYQTSKSSFLGLEVIVFENENVEGTFTMNKGSEVFNHVSLFNKQNNKAVKLASNIFHELFEKHGRAVRKLEDYLNAFNKTFLLMVELGF